MTGFVTIFEITPWSNGVLTEWIIRLLIGFGALGFGIWSVIRARKNKGQKVIKQNFLIVWAIVWITLHMFPNMFGRIQHLVNAYGTKQYQIAEGPVTVTHQQPF